MTTSPSPMTRGRRSPFWRAVAGPIGALIAAAVFAVAALAARVVAEGRAELARCDAALARGAAEEAIGHARRAAASYVPFAAHVAEAYDRLTSVARQAEGRGDYVTALSAWRAVRSASVASRTVVLTTAARRAEADRAIVYLSSVGADAASRTAAAGGDPAGLDLTQLRALPTPGTATIGLRVAAALALAASLAWAARAASSGGGKLDLRNARRPLLAVAAAVAAWALGFWVG